MPGISKFEKLLVSDIDSTLTGNCGALQKLDCVISARKKTMAFAVATGRHLSSTLEVLAEWKAPDPRFLICDVGTSIWDGKTLAEDETWIDQLSDGWNRDDVENIMSSIPGITHQEEERQARFKVSFYVSDNSFPGQPEVSHRLEGMGIKANVILTKGKMLDILPERASKGHAVRHLAAKLGISLDNVLVAGDAGNDEEMLTSGALGIVVGNHHPELEPLRDRKDIYFASGNHALGILEGIRHYGF